MKLTDEILNYGLRLSMDFGDNWLKPINSRLAEKYPELSKSEALNCDKLCKKINNEAHNFVKQNPVKTENTIGFIDPDGFNSFMLDKFSWIDSENLSKLYSQSCYYARK